MVASIVAILSLIVGIAGTIITYRQFRHQGKINKLEVQIAVQRRINTGHIVRGDVIPVELELNNISPNDVSIKVQEGLPDGIKIVSGPLKWKGQLQANAKHTLHYSVQAETTGRKEFSTPFIHATSEEHFIRLDPIKTVFDVEDVMPANLLLKQALVPRFPNCRDKFELAISWSNTGSLPIDKISYQIVTNSPELTPVTDLDELAKPFSLERFHAVEHRVGFIATSEGQYSISICNIAFEASGSSSKLPDQDVSVEVEFKWDVPIVGRTNELQTVFDLVKRAKESVGKLVFIHGEAGVGKSKLSHEVIKYAETLDFLVLEEFCESFTEAIAFHPFKRLFQQVINTASPRTTSSSLTSEDNLARVRAFFSTHFPEIKQSLPILNYFLIGESDIEAAKLSMSPRDRHEAFLTAIYGFIKAISLRNPVLIVIEDLQFADSGTIDVIQHLGTRCRDLPVLILCLYRDEDIKTVEWHEQLFVRSISKMLIDNLCISIELRRLKELQVKSLLNSYFPNSQFPAEFADRLFQETEGNPLYVREVLKCLIDKHDIIKVDSVWKLARLTTDIPLPRTIEEGIRSHLRVLKSKEELRELERAAVIGYNFSYKFLRELSPLDESSLMEYLEKFLDHHLIIEAEVN